jgi:hypothetical protein
VLRHPEALAQPRRAVGDLDGARQQLELKLIHDAV